MKYSIEILPHQKTIKTEANRTLGECLQAANTNIRFDCNRLGLCGKCVVQILQGNLPPPNEEEKFFLSETQLQNRFRLACLFTVQSDLKIKIPESSTVQEQLILKTGYGAPVQVDSAVKKFLLKLSKPTIAEPHSLVEIIRKGLKNHHLAVGPGVLKSFGQKRDGHHSQITAVVHKNCELFAIEEGNTLDCCFGFAVDLGTTTIVVELIDLKTGESVGIRAGENPQIQFGADVVSRIGFAVLDSKNLETLQNTVIDKLNLMFTEILSRHNVAPSSVYEIVLAGNTTMNHILLGLPLQSLAQTPFTSLFTSFEELPASSYDLHIHPSGKLYLAPNIQSFVGGDVSAGLIASGLLDLGGNILFIDLGTNGEIVLKTEDQILATSTAAGPAFEGMNISCGMLALPGAIHRVEKKEKIEVSTLLDEPAKGLCGTGLIDCVALFLDEGQITSRGKIRNQSKTIPITSQFDLTQKDIREVQLAVAAVKTGRNMMLKKFSLDPGRLNAIFIAGAFGNCLNIRNSIRIGLLPALPEEKIHFIGNSSLAGARALLISAPLREKIKTIVQKIQYVSLASDPQFQDHFVDSLDFPP